MRYRGSKVPEADYFSGIKTQRLIYAQIYRSFLTFNIWFFHRFSKCKVNVDKEGVVHGAINLHFDLKEYFYIKNTVPAFGKEEEFITRFKFSNKAKVVIPLNSDHTG